MLPPCICLHQFDECLSVSIVSDEVLLNIEYKVECEENVHVIVEVRRLQSDEKTIIN